jgi:hypothetical protein
MAIEDRSDTSTPDRRLHVVHPYGVNWLSAEMRADSETNHVPGSSKKGNSPPNICDYRTSGGPWDFMDTLSKICCTTENVGSI